MANKEVTAIEIKAQADRAVKDINKLVAAYNKQQQSIRSLSETTRRMGRSFTASARAAASFRSALGLIGIGSLGFQLRNAAQGALEFERAMINIQKTTGITGAELQTLGSSLENLAEQLGTNATELARFTGLAGQLGIRGVQGLLKFTEVITKLQRATNLIGEEASTQLARVMQLTSSDVVRDIEAIGSVIVKLGNNLATTEREFVAIAEAIAPVMRVFESSAEDVLSYSAALASVGVEGQAASTALLRLFGAMENAAANTKENRRELELFAEVMKMTAEEAKNLIETDVQLAGAKFLGGLGDVQNKPEVLSRLVTPALRSQRPLLALSSPLIENAVSMGREERKNPVELAREILVQLEAAPGKLDQSIQTLQTSFRDLGEAINSVVIPAMESLAALMRGIRSFNPFGSSSRDPSKDDILKMIEGNTSNAALEVFQATKQWDNYNIYEKRDLYWQAHFLGGGPDGGNTLDDLTSRGPAIKRKHLVINPDDSPFTAWRKAFTNSMLPTSWEEDGGDLHEARQERIRAAHHTRAGLARPVGEFQNSFAGIGATGSTPQRRVIDTGTPEDPDAAWQAHEKAYEDFVSSLTSLSPEAAVATAIDLRDEAKKFPGTEARVDMLNRLLEANRAAQAQTADQALAEFMENEGRALLRTGRVREYYQARRGVLQGAIRNANNLSVVHRGRELLDETVQMQTASVEMLREMERSDRQPWYTRRDRPSDRPFSTDEEARNEQVDVARTAQDEARLTRLQEEEQARERHLENLIKLERKYEMEMEELKKRQAKEEYDAAVRNYNAQKTAWMSLSRTIHRGIAGMMMDLSSFEDMMKSLALQMANMVLAQTVTQPLAGALGAGFDKFQAGVAEATANSPPGWQWGGFPEEPEILKKGKRYRSFDHMLKELEGEGGYSAAAREIEGNVEDILMDTEELAKKFGEEYLEGATVTKIGGKQYVIALKDADINIENGNINAEGLAHDKPSDYGPSELAERMARQNSGEGNPFAYSIGPGAADITAKVEKLNRVAGVLGEIGSQFEGIGSGGGVGGAVAGGKKKGNWFNALLNVGASILTGGKMAFMADGGVVRQAGLAIVGERGPEMLELPAGAKVTPLDPMDKMGGRGPVNITLNVNGVQDPVVFDRVLDEKMPLIKAAVKGDIAESVGDNSDFSAALE